MYASPFENTLFGHLYAGNKRFLVYHIILPRILNSKFGLFIHYRYGPKHQPILLIVYIYNFNKVTSDQH
jgi:hypothetical protein